jgi:DNA-binding winged helix-turn-helix (wHTH) protein/tetratricopeptide (TPR) repeat protein
VTQEPARTVIRFGVFEADLQNGELRRAGVRVKLQAQPFRVLTLLLERSGEIITRDEIVRNLWGDDTYVDFDQGVGAVVRRLRLALGDSGSTPRYIETLRGRGYRFLVPTITEVPPAQLCPVPSPRQQGTLCRLPWRSPYLALWATMTIAVLVLLIGIGRRTGSTVSDTDAPAQRATARPRNTEAWLAYQKGRHLWTTRTAPAIETSIRYLQKAVQFDPDYAPAYAGLADAYVLQNFYTGRHSKRSVRFALAASERALGLDPAMAQAHATQAYIRFYYDWDWSGAEKGFRKAIALDPGYATAHQWYAEYLFYMGRFEEALRVINRAHELEPQSAVISLQVASPDLYSGKYAQAIEKIREAKALNPEFALGTYMLATCYEQLGRFDEAIEEYGRITGTTLGLTGLGYAYGRSGRQEEARQILQKLIEGWQREDVSAYHVARVFAGLGESSQALAWLKKAHAARDERMVMVRVDPKLSTLRSEPLFRDLLGDLGLPEDQLSGGGSARLGRSLPVLLSGAWR